MSNPFAKKPQLPVVPDESEVTTAVRSAVAENAVADSLVDETPMAEYIEPEEERFTGYKKLSALVDKDFPFDESQLDAIEGLANTDYGCLTGAAGTGKTTTTKAVVDRLMDTTTLGAVDMAGYWKKGSQGADPDDEYEMPDEKIPAVAMCAFTGRATQMIKKNFPRDWHGNIMTIHRMLGFVPEWYEEWDEESGEMKNKMRFAPSYNEHFKMPWDIIIIDEAGMLGLDLWLQLRAAMKDGCRIIMIGDINQLPPVHGKSIFGYAMCNWPAWELTHIHRQQGAENPIVDNAWRIIHGQMPQSEGRFQMVELKGDAQFSSRQVRKMAQVLRERGVYDPIRDTIITPINGEEGSRGFALGQLPLNREFALMFNPQSEHPRFIIDGGRERKQFAVGDKVMATKNDWEAGITNGMTGVITEIQENAEYSGDRRLFGPVEEVNRYLAENEDAKEYVDFSLEELDESLLAIDKGMEKKKESRDRGPASHVVTVRFGEGEHGIEIPFNTLAEVASLMTAYVVTCHKMQGGEAPVIIIIVHDSHKAMLYREWLYTAVTRASQKCIMLYKIDALRTALNKQKMPGRTLKEKVLSFNKMQNIEVEDSDGNIIQIGRDVRLPESNNPRNRILEMAENERDEATARRLTTDAEKSGGLMQLVKKQRESKSGQEPRHEPEVQRVKLVVETVHRTVHERVERVNITPSPDTRERRPEVDGGELTPERKSPPEGKEETPTPLQPPVPQLPAPPVAVSLPGAAFAAMKIRDAMEGPRLLTFVKSETPPAPVAAEKPKVFNPFAKRPA